MTTFQILKEDLKISQTKFNTVADFIEAIEDLKLWQIMSNNKWETFDVNILKKKYLW